MGTLRFIGLAMAAVVLGVLSASFAFGRLGSGLPGFENGIPVGMVETVGNAGGLTLSRDVNFELIRHIERRN